MNTAVQQEIKAPQKRSYSVTESVFAWICVVLGYLLCRTLPVNDNPLGAMVFVILLFCTTAVVLALNNAKFGFFSVICALSAISAAVSLIFTQNGFIHFFIYSYCLLAYVMFVYTAYRNHAKKRFTALFLLDFFKALFVSPFISFVAIFKSFFSNNKVNARPILKILLGIAVAFVPTVVIILLLSYDSDFTDLLDKLFDFDLLDVMSHFSSIFFGIPLAMYGYGAFISAADKKTENIISEESFNKFTSYAKIMPRITALAAVLPILSVYVLFFISQWKYYVSGFVGVLPDELSYAEYARQGFFQLCIVAVINFLIIAVIGLFTKRKNEKPSAIERLLSIVLSMFTLVLIATAVAKMIMYIDIYGLTPKRVYATWFMAVLAIIFILVIIKQLATKFPLVFLSVCTVVVMLTGLAYSQTDKIIADYNVDRYLDGTLDSIDTDILIELGDAAVPASVKLLLYWNDEFGMDQKFYMESYPSSPFNHFEDDEKRHIYYKYKSLIFEMLDRAVFEEDSIWSFTFPSDDAKKAMDKLGIIEFANEYNAKIEESAEATEMIRLP